MRRIKIIVAALALTVVWLAQGNTVKAACQFEDTCWQDVGMLYEYAMVACPFYNGQETVVDLLACWYDSDNCYQMASVYFHCVDRLAD